MSVISELTNLEATHVSYVRKGANKKQFFLMKSDDSVTPVFEKEFDIFINKADTEKKLVYGVVYEPDLVDTQGDFAKAEEIEKAAHKFLTDCRNVDLQHNFKPGFGDVVESYVAPTDFKVGGKEIKKDSWVLVTKATEEVWEGIKKGEITGYSMAGKATRTPVKENNIKKEAFDHHDSEVKGFFDVMKSFFTGGKIEKADDAGKIKSFAQRMAVNDVMEGMWRVTDALRTTMNDILSSVEIKDKKAGLEKAIDEFAAYMKKRVSALDDANVKKADIDFYADEPVAKTSKTISSVNMQKIKGAHEALGTLIALEKNQNNEGDAEMKKEELQEMLKSAIEAAVKPINEKLDALEKQDGNGAQGEENQAEQTNEDISAVIKTAVDEAIKPLSDRMSAFEKARGISRQEEEEQNREPVKKSLFSSIEI